jgi:apolipoprotein D and lipocalin family protein
MGIKLTVSILVAVTVTLVIMNSCVSIPKNVSAVKSFRVEKYLGKWYEIARMDFRFERNLGNVTAQYSLNDDGSIRVCNTGYDINTNERKQAIGKAKFRGDNEMAMLKVSFFGPFYSGYNVIAIDDDYKYALVAGKSLRYLWLLSREAYMPDDVRNSYLKIATDLGFDTKALLWTKQEKTIE